MFEYLAALIVTHIPKARDERGLSQSTENALLVVGVIGLVAAVVAAVTFFVKTRLGAGLQ